MMKSQHYECFGYFLILVCQYDDNLSKLVEGYRGVNTVYWFTAIQYSTLFQAQLVCALTPVPHYHSSTFVFMLELYRPVLVTLSGVS